MFDLDGELRLRSHFLPRVGVFDEEEPESGLIRGPEVLQDRTLAGG